MAVAYVSVVPSLKGFADNLRRQVTGPSNAAAQQAARGMTQTFNRAGTQMQSAGAVMTAAVTAPVAALGKSVIETGLNFETAMLKVKAVSGATGEEFDQLESLAKELGSTTQYSASQAADAMGFLAMAGFDATETITALPGVLDLAAAGALELGQAADIASNILSGYGLETHEIGRLNDVLAKTFTSTNVNLQMLGESFKYVGPVGASAGVQFEELSAAIGLLGNAGIQGSEAGTALRASIARLLSPTKDVSDTLTELGVKVTDSAGDLLPLVDIIEQLETSGAKTADMMTIFGLEAGPAMQAIVSQGSEALRELSAELENSGGWAQNVAEIQMSGAAGAFNTFKAAVEGLAIEIAQAGALEWAANLATRLASLTQTVSTMNPELFRIGSIVALVVAVAGPALVLFGTAVSAVGTAFAVLATPVGIAIGVIAAVAAGLAYLYLTCEPVRAVVNEIAGAVAGTFTDAWTSAGTALTTTVLPALRDMGAELLDAVVPVVLDVADVLTGTVVPALLDFGQMIAGNVLPVLRDLATTVVSIVSAVVPAVAGALIPIFRALADIFTGTVMPAISGIVLAIRENLTPIFAAIADFVRDRVVPAISDIGDKLSDLVEKAQPVVSVVTTVISWLAQFAASIIGAVVPAILRLAGPIFSALATGVGWVLTALGFVFDVVGFVVTAFSLLGDAAVWLWEKALRPAFNFIDAAVRVLLTLLVVLFVAPVVVALKLLGGIASWLWEKAFKPALGFIGDAADYLWNSHLKPIFRAIGDAATWLWEKALKPAFDFITTAFEAVGKAFKWVWDKVLEPVFKWIADKGEWLWDKALKPAFNWIKKGVGAVGDAFEDAKEAIKLHWDALKGIAKKPVKFIIDTVYNKGIVPLWNKVAKAFGAPQLTTMDVSNWHTGGILPGYTPGRDVHLAALSGGEAVMRPEWTRAVGSGWINGMNALARTGGVGAVQSALGGGLPGYALGGIVDTVSGVVGGVIDWTKETGREWLGKGLKKLLDTVVPAIPGSGTGFVKMLTDIPYAMVDRLLGAAEDAESAMSGSGAWNKPLITAMGARYGQAGRMWSSGYHTGTDFPAPSGTSIRAVADGVVAAISRTGPYGNHVTLAHAGKMASLYAHMSSMAVRVGQSITQGQSIGRVGSTGNSSGPHLHLEAFKAGARMNPESLFDSGGWLRPGVTPVRNATGQPEPVLTGNQWRNVATLANRSDAGLRPGDRLILSPDGRTEFSAYVERRADDAADRRMNETLINPARRGRR